jgi:hypothetical protein
MNKKILILLTLTLALISCAVFVTAAYQTGNFFDDSFTNMDEVFQKYSGVMKSIGYTALNVQGDASRGGLIDGKMPGLNIEFIIKLTLAVIIGILAWLSLDRLDLFSDEKSKKAAKVIACFFAWGAAAILPRALLLNIYFAYSGMFSLLIFGSFIAGVVYLRLYVFPKIQYTELVHVLNALVSVILILMLLLLNNSVHETINSLGEVGVGGIASSLPDTSDALEQIPGIFLFVIFMIKLATFAAIFLLGYDIIRLIITIVRLIRQKSIIDVPPTVIPPIDLPPELPPGDLPPIFPPGTPGGKTGEKIIDIISGGAETITNITKTNKPAGEKLMLLEDEIRQIAPMVSAAISGSKIARANLEKMYNNGQLTAKTTIAVKKVLDNLDDTITKIRTIATKVDEAKDERNKVMKEFIPHAKKVISQSTLICEILDSKLESSKFKAWNSLDNATANIALIEIMFKQFSNAMDEYLVELDHVIKISKGLGEIKGSRRVLNGAKSEGKLFIEALERMLKKSIPKYYSTIEEYKSKPLEKEDLTIKLNKMYVEIRYRWNEVRSYVPGAGVIGNHSSTIASKIDAALIILNNVLKKIK